MYNPHIVPVGWSGDWNISFVTNKMTMKLNNTSTEMVHIAAGAFYDVDWLYGLNEMLPNNYKVTARVKGNITSLTDGDWLRIGVAIAAKATNTNDDFFTEVDFYWGQNVGPPFSDAVLIHEYQFGINESFSVNIDLTQHLETWWNIDYEIWAVYLVIEAKNAYMQAEFYEFSVWYDKRTNQTNLDPIREITQVVASAFGVAITIIIVKKFAKTLIKE